MVRFFAKKCNANKFGNLNELDKFLKEHAQTDAFRNRMSIQPYFDYRNIIQNQNSPIKETPCLNGSQVNYTKHLKKKL